jgi:signal transduction histidine kinase
VPGTAAHRPTSPSSCSTFAIDELAAGLDEIRTLASGLHPSLLSERGLTAALEALALRVPVAIELEALTNARLPEPVEAAAYYVVAEALANVQKHAGARRVVVSVTADEHGRPGGSLARSRSPERRLSG